MNQIQSRSHRIIAVKHNLEQIAKADVYENKVINKSALRSQEFKLFLISICVLILLIYQYTFILKGKASENNNLRAKSLENHGTSLLDWQENVKDEEDIDGQTQIRRNENLTSNIVRDIAVLDNTKSEEKADISIVTHKLKKDEDQSNLHSNLRVEKNIDKGGVKWQKEEIKETYNEIKETINPKGDSASKNRNDNRMEKFREIPTETIKTEIIYIDSQRSQIKLTEENSPNVLFYQNRIPAQPDRVFLDTIHNAW